MKHFWLALAGICLSFSAHSAAASLLWGWEVLNSNMTIGSHDGVKIMARLINLPGSDRNFTSDDIGGFGIFDADIRAYYDVLDALPGDPYQFDKLNIAPGQSFYFQHFVLLPKTDVPITQSRTFTFDTSFVINQAKLDIVPTGFIINQFSFKVDVPGTGMPEPMPLYLLGIGLLGILLQPKFRPRQSA
jgi:hypothetical protein